MYTVDHLEEEHTSVRSEVRTYRGVDTDSDEANGWVPALTLSYAEGAPAILARSCHPSEFGYIS